MFKRIITAFILSLIMITAFLPLSVGAAENYSETDGFEFVCENEKGELYAVLSGNRAGEFFYRRKSDGFCQYSNPKQNGDNKLSDEEKSQLVFLIYNKTNRSVRQVNSYVATDKGKNITVKKNKTGIEIIYSISNSSIEYPLSVNICDDGIRVESNSEQIKSNDGSYVVNVTVLPYFGCTQAGTDGYTLVPDGSGALIYHNKTNNGSYSQKVYGTDIAFAEDLKRTETQTALLPIFGVKAELGSIFAIAEEGKECATVNAKATPSYNCAYYSFQLIGNDVMDLGESGSGYKIVNDLYAVDMPLTDGFQILYAILDQGSGYNEMADFYKQYLSLKSDKSFSKSNPSLFLELYGGINKKESFYGIPMTRLKKLTTVSQASDISEYFIKECGENLRVILRSFDSAIIGNKIQNKLSVRSKLGSKKQLKNLSDMLDGRLYLENDIYSAEKSGNGFFKFSQSSVRINRKNIIMYDYNPATTNADRSIKFAYVIKPKALEKILNKYFTSVEKFGLKTAFVNLANSSYSDFTSKNYTSRGNTIEKFSSLLNKYGENGMLYYPADYALNYGEAVTDTPMFSSGFDMTDTDVPFYELIISGVMEYSTDSINLKSDISDAFLKAIEYGASLKFSLVYENISDVKNTYLDNIHGVEFGKWQDTIVSYQKQFTDIFDDIGSHVIAEHYILSSDVNMTVYDNGNAVLINYSDADYKTEYGTVPSNGYLIVREGAVYQ